MGGTDTKKSSSAANAEGGTASKTVPSTKEREDEQGESESGETEPTQNERRGSASRSSKDEPKEASKGPDEASHKSADPSSGAEEKPAAGRTGAESNGTKKRSPDEEAYEKVKKSLRELVAKKSDIDRELEDIEERIFVEEGAYLQETNAGNVAKGFEHYTKGSQNRRKSLLGEHDRVFSQSSTSFEAES